MSILKELVVDDNNIVYNQMLGNSYQLNDVSKEILVLLQEDKTKEEIVEFLSTEYEVSANDAFIDVTDFLSKLKVYGLL